MPEGGAIDFDIRKYLGILKRRKYVALAVALAVLSILTWGSFLLPKTYEATSTVFIERSLLIDPLIKGVGVSANMDERLRNLKNSLASRSLIERVVKKLDLDVEAKNPGQYENLIEGIKKKLNVTVKGGERGGRDTDLFTIIYQGGEPRRVRDVVNTLVNEYIEENLKFRRTDAYSAYEFIQAQLLEYKKKLEESDAGTRAFRETNPTMVPQSENAVLGRIEGLQASKMETDIKLKELMRKRENLQKQLSGEKELTVAVVTREGSPQARLNYLNNQLMLLMTKYTASHPEVIKVRSEMEELKRQISQAKDSHSQSISSETAAINPIYQQLREELAKTEAEIESLRGRMGELSRQQNEVQGVLGRMPKEQEEWAKLQRDRNVYQKIYDDLLQKLENAKVSKDLELTDKSASFRVVDAATLPAFPIKPDRVKMILLGIVLGIASGLGVALGLEYIDQSFKDEESIEAKLRVPVLASIPQITVDTEEQSEKRLDKKVFTFAGAYLAVIVVVLVVEVLNRYLGIKVISF